MTLSLNTGIASTMLGHYLDKYSNSYGKTLEQLASGNKATKIADDPIAVTKSRKIQCKIDSNSQALENMNIANNLLDTSEDTQKNVIDNLQRIRDLSMEAANGTNSSDDKDQILVEIKQRLTQIDNTADSTSFNGIKLFDGSLKTLKIQTGSQSSNSIDIASAFTNLHVSQLGGDIRLDDTVTGNTWTTDNIDSYLLKLDNAIDQLTNNCGTCGSFTTRLDNTISTVQNKNTNMTGQKSDLMDTDTASVCADMVKFQILQQATASMFTQINQIPGYAVQLLQSVS